MLGEGDGTTLAGPTRRQALLDAGASGTFAGPTRGACATRHRGRYNTRGAQKEHVLLGLRSGATLTESTGLDKAGKECVGGRYRNQRLRRQGARVYSITKVIY